MHDGGRPEWLKVGAPIGDLYDRTESIVGKHRLNTVCMEAVCPNRRECYDAMTATFMILGHICTRDCGFCAVVHGQPDTPDAGEPERIAAAVSELGLEYVVITSVTRDDLSDGGAGHFASTVDALKGIDGQPAIETLIPDFKGDRWSLSQVVDSHPDVISHNVETVPSLYERVRPGASYIRSLRLLEAAKDINGDIKTKSGIMLGLGETISEIESVFRALIGSGCDYLTIGQYLRPSPANIPVREYMHPERFESLKNLAEDMGFIHVEAGPLVRSSYHAALPVR